LSSSASRVRVALWIAAGVGLIGAVLLILREGLPDILRLLDIAGWRLLWLVPAHVVPLACFAAAWQVLLRHERSETPGIVYLTWGATVREAVAGLLPVARVGGEVVGVRLLVRRHVPASTASASVIVELTLTMVAQVTFAAIGLIFLAGYPTVGPAIRIVAIGIVLAIFAIAAFVVVVKRWGRSVFALMQRVIGALGGGEQVGGDPARFHEVLHATYADRFAVVACGVWQLIGFLVGAFETWLALRLIGQPGDVRMAIVLESLATAVQSAMFMVPGGLGTQEGGFVLFGAAVGLSPQASLALSLARRMRQVVLGLPALLSWFWAERNSDRPSRIPYSGPTGADEY
jgi:putative membrane protein